MKEYLKLWATLIIPVWFFDGCANRDPTYQLDENTQLIAIASSEPLSLDYRDPSGDVWFQVHEVNDFLMNETVFTGASERGYFIVPRTDPEPLIFDSQSARDAALQSDFGLTTEDLHPRPWHAGLRGNSFFPYNLIYYGLATAGAGVYVVGRRRQKKTEPNEVVNSE